MCGHCGKIHQHSLVSSKTSLKDYEVLERDNERGLLLVREVDVCKDEYADSCDTVHIYDVELFETFYSRMH